MEEREIMGQERLNGGWGWEGSIEEVVWITKDL